MRFALMTVVAATMLAPLASAQKLEIKLDAIAAKASQKTEVDLDGALLKLARTLSRLDQDSKAVGDWLGGVQAIHVRSYHFDKDGAYSPAELEPLRRQATEAAGWSRIMNIKQHGEDAEIFINTQGGKIGGFLVVSAGDRELNVVYLLGTLTLAQVKGLAESDVAESLMDFASLAQIAAK